MTLYLIEVADNQAPALDALIDRSNSIHVGDGVQQFELEDIDRVPEEEEVV